MLTQERPILLRSTGDMVRMLMTLPAEQRNGDHAAASHRRAVAIGDEEDALFWSEVLLLLQACEEAGVPVSTETLAHAGDGQYRPAAAPWRVHSAVRALLASLTRPVLQGIARRHA